MWRQTNGKTCILKGMPGLACFKNELTDMSHIMRISAKTKIQISCIVTVQLICVFVFMT